MPQRRVQVLTRCSYKCMVAIFSGVLVFSSNTFSQNKLPAAYLRSIRSELLVPEVVANYCSKSRVTSSPSGCGPKTTNVPLEWLDLGLRGDAIAHAREQTLQILQDQNTCTAWFQEADPDVVEVFRSLHYQLDEGASAIYSLRNDMGGISFKHPWGARTSENSGANSIIHVNSNGPFFIRKASVIHEDHKLTLVALDSWQFVMIGPYIGDIPEARITIMLHELGHIVGRLPEDNGSWDGRSTQNTADVLRHCKREIHLMARKEP